MILRIVNPETEEVQDFVSNRNVIMMFLTEDERKTYKEAIDKGNDILNSFPNNMDKKKLERLSGNFISLVNMFNGNPQLNAQSTNTENGDSPALQLLQENNKEQKNDNKKGTE